METFVRTLIITGVFLGVGTLVTSGGYAQSWSSSPQSQQREAPSVLQQEKTESLPEWAKPQSETNSDRQQRSSSSDMRTKVPGSGPGVPIGGGVVWLVLAGGGYATWKLGFSTSDRKG